MRLPVCCAFGRPTSLWPASGVRVPIVVVILLLVNVGSALAFVREGQVGSIHYRVLAPDWICRGEVVSVLIVVSADRVDGGDEAEPRVVVADLTPALSGFQHAPDAVTERRVELTAGEIERFSFTGWKARIDADLGRFTFGLRLADPRENESVSLTIPVDTIRGAAVPRGIWSILVPLAISLLALPLFALLLKRTARPGAWKRVVDLEIAPAEEAWWKTAT